MRMRTLGRSGVTLALYLVGLVALAQDDVPALVVRIQPCVVEIEALSRQGRVLKTGTGFFVDPSGSIVTNFHVVEGASRVIVRSSEPQAEEPAVVAATDVPSDLAVLTLRGSSLRPFLPLTSRTPRAGERVVVVGSPLGLDRTVTDGIVSAVRELPNGTSVIQITAPISPGSSGSPVVDLNGEVLGVATFRFREGQNLNFATSISQIGNLLKRAAVPNADTALPAWENRESAALPDRSAVESRRTEALARALDQVKAEPDSPEAHVALGRARGLAG